MKELVFLLEERSARVMLEGLLPRIGIDLCQIKYMVFEGKKDLELNITKKLRAYRNPEARFIIIRDLDSEPDRKAVKKRMAALCTAAGKSEMLIRILCKELETIFLADLEAVELGLNIKGLAARQNERKFRMPDNIPSPSRELSGLTKGIYQKIGGSRAIARHLDVENIRSPSFSNLVLGIKRFSFGVP